MIFRTNIDCMKRFVSNITTTAIQPMLGDTVEVYCTTTFAVELEVVSRRWNCDEGNWCLDVELYLPKNSWQSLAQFIEVMRQNGIY